MTSPPEVRLALDDRIITDGPGIGEQVAAAAQGGRGAAKGPAKPFASDKPFASEKSLADFTSAISSGRDLQAALDDLVGAEIRQALARGVPKNAAQQAAELFVAELAANLSGRMAIAEAVADAERVFVGAIKSFLAAGQTDPLMTALITGEGIDGALSAAGVSGKGQAALGRALAAGEGHSRAVAKGHQADDAQAKAAAIGADAELLNALGSGEGGGAELVALSDPVAAQRFAELLQQGVPLAAAAAAAKAAAAAAHGARGAADAASKTGLEALASGKGADGVSAASAEVAQALAQAGASPGPGNAAAAGGGLMEALASGQGVAGALGNGGGAYEQSLGAALANGASLSAAQSAAARAAQAQGAAAGSASPLEQLASGNAGALSGSAAFDAALGEALAQGKPIAQAIAEAAGRAATVAQAVQMANAASGTGTATDAGGGGGPGGSVAPAPGSALASSSAGRTGVGGVAAASSSANAASAGDTGGWNYSPPPSSSVTTTTAPPALTTASIAVAVSPAPAVTTTGATAPLQSSRNDVVPPPANHLPTMQVADTATLAEDGSVTLEVSAADSDGSISSIVAASDNSQLLPAGGMTVRDGKLTLAPAANQYGSAKVTLTATDNAGGTVSRTVAVTVTPVNDAPTVSGAVTAAIEEDVALAANSGVSVASLLAGKAADVENDAVGMAVTGVGASGGNWQYSLDGTTWRTLSGTSEAAARLLAPSALVRFVPDLNWNGDTAIAFRPWDQTAGGGNGGTAEVANNPNRTFGASHTATLTVAAVNDAPTITAQAATIGRGAVISLDGKLEAADVDNTAAKLTYTVTAGPGDGALYRAGMQVAVGGSFTQQDIDSGLVTYQHFGAKGVGDDSFGFSLSDGAGGVLAARTFSLTVGASTAPLNVHAYAPTTAQSLTSFTYTNSNGFTTRNNGSFTFTNVVAPASSATLTVTAYDVNYTLGERDQIRLNGHYLGTLGGSLWTTSSTVWSVAPWVASGTNTVSVYVEPVSILGISTEVHEAILRSATLKLTVAPLAGADISAFDVVGGTVDGSTAYADARAVVAVTTAGDYRLTFRLLTAAGALVDSKTATFTAAANTVVAVNGSPSYALAAASGGYQVQAVLESTAAGSGHVIKAQSFNHTQNVGPAIADAALMVASTAAVETVVARLGHSDSDLNQQVTYSLLDDAGQRFKLVIPAATGVPEIRLAKSLVGEGASQYVLQIKATDAEGQSRVESFTVAVSTVNQAPTGSDLTVSAVEDTAVTGAAAFSDLDGDTLTYSLVAQGSHGTAVIDAATGQWSYTPVANWSGTDSLQIGAADPTHAVVPRTVTVEVAAVNDAPTASDGVVAATEDTATPLAASAFGFADVDGDALASVKILSAAGDGSFQGYDSATGTWATLNLSSAQEFTAAQLASGYLRYVPPAAGNGAHLASLTFQVSDGQAYSATKTLKVDVAAVNDALSLADRAYLKSAANVQLSSFTFEAWVRTTDKGSAFTGIVATLGSANYAQMCLNTAGQLVLEVQGGGSNRLWHGGSDVADGNWHHVAVSYDATGGAAKLYVDGQGETVTQVSAVGVSAPVPAIDAALVVGIDRVPENSQSLDGAVDEVRVWNDVRSAAEIAADMKRQLSGSEANLAGYWRFEDAPGGAYAAVVGPALVAQRGALRLDARDGSVDTLTLANTGHALDVGAAGTVELWVSMDDWNTGSGQDPMILSSGPGGLDGNCLYIDSHDVSGLHFRYGFGAGSTALTYAASRAWAAGSWHHVAATWDSAGGNATLVLYVDGVAVNTTTTIGFAVANLSPVWTVGRDPSGGAAGYANGMVVDDLRIWSVARSAAEIATDGKTVATGSETGLAGYWKLDERSGATAADATGHGNTGTLGNATWTNADIAATSPRDDTTSRVYTLSGGKYLQSGTKVTLTGDHAVEAWVKAPASEGAWTGIAGLRNDGTNGTWSNMVFNDSGHLRVDLGTEAGWRWYDVTTGPVVNDGVWHHVAYSFAEVGDKVTAWIDGVQYAATLVNWSEKATGAAADIDWYATNSSVLVGVEHTAGAVTLDGAVDGVRLWDRALGTTEVQSHMTSDWAADTAGLLGQWSFGDTLASGTTAANTLAVQGAGGSSGFATATLSAAPSLANPAYALTLDGVDDKAVVAGGVNVANHSFSWEYWGYRDTSGTADIALSQGSAVTDGGLRVGYGADGRFVFGFSNDDLAFTSMNTGVATWTHWAGTYDAASNTRILYRNGAEVARDVAAGDYNGGGAFTIGSDVDGSGAYDGRIDEVRVWNDVRSAAEIRDNYNHGLGGSEADLAGYWRFDQGSGTSAAESSGNAQAAVLSGGAAWNDLFDQTASQGQTSRMLVLGQNTGSGSDAFALVGGNGGAAHGTATIDANGVLSFAATSAGEDNISYQITDAGGQVSQGVVHVVVS